ncbi:MAG: NYN domain-containing protein [Nitrospira sp.]|nr:NYN domain-containing protein [Nitrospira sp.]
MIVDGHNLLAETSRISGGVSLHSEMACEALLRHLAAYRQRKAHAMTVVCDGW